MHPTPRPLRGVIPPRSDQTDRVMASRSWGGPVASGCPSHTRRGRASPPSRGADRLNGPLMGARRGYPPPLLSRFLRDRGAPFGYVGRATTSDNTLRAQTATFAGTCRLGSAASGAGRFYLGLGGG